MSDRDEVEANFRRAVREFIECARGYGFTYDQASELAKRICLKESDQVAREKRAQFKIVKSDPEESA
jgi:hypothetical protein